MSVLYIVTEVEKLAGQEPECRVCGVYSNKELAQKAMVKAIGSLCEGAGPETSWGQEATDKGLVLADSTGNRYTYNIVMRNLDELM